MEKNFLIGFDFMLALVLAAMEVEFGFAEEPAGLAWLYIGYFRKKFEFSRIIKWKTDYLYVYFVWVAVVGFVFPGFFWFR